MSKPAWQVRDFDASRDAEAVRRLDTSFTSDCIYAVRHAGNTLHLELAPAHPPRSKRLPVDLGVGAWARGYVAVLGERVQGFVAMGYEPWNRRMTIWHFYIDASHRWQGGGRLLMHAALEWGRRAEARTAWIETTHVNAPGIEAYRHLGFEICGFDTSLYTGTAAEGEVAIYMARSIASDDSPLPGPRSA